MDHLENISSVTFSNSKLPLLKHELNVHVGDDMTDAQRETAARAAQGIRTHGSFLLSDGTGVGKGRVMAAVAADFVASHERARVMWISTSQKMKAVTIEEACKLKSAKKVLRWTDKKSTNPNCMFMTYAGLQTSSKRHEVTEWIRAGKTCLFVMDECHWMRLRTKSTKIVLGVLDRFEERASFLFVSATPASSASQLHYLDRVIKDEHCDVDAMLRKYGSAAMEALALDLRSRGKLLCKHMPSGGVKVETRVVTLTVEERSLYDTAAARLLRSPSTHQHQLFFRNLIASLKTRDVLACIRREIQEGRSVVVCVQSTGEAAARRSRSMRTPTGMCFDYIRRVTTAHDLHFPLDIIDACLAEFGEEAISDLTGRSRQRKTYSERYLDFCNDRTFVALISRSGSTGISLHARTPTSRPRVQIMVELPWTAEVFLQQCGRVHRAFEAHLPKYIFFRTDVPAEERFVLSLQSRLRCTSAVTSADRFGTNDMGKAIRLSPTVVMRIKNKRFLAVHVLYRHYVHLFPTRSPCILRTRRERGHFVDTAALLEKFKSDDNVVDFLDICEREFAETTLWRAEAWVQELHGLTTSRFRNSVFLILLANHFSSESPFYALPKSVLELIINYSCEEVHGSDVVPVLEAVGVCPFDLPTFSVEKMFNAMLRMTTQNQRSFRCLLESHCAEQSESPYDRTLLSLLNRDLNGFYEYDVVRSHQSDGCLEIEVNGRPSHVPKFEQAFLFHDEHVGGIRSGDELFLYSKGQMVPYVMTTDKEKSYERAGLLCRLNDLVECNRMHSNAARKLYRRGGSRCGWYRFALQDMCRQYESSLRQIVTNADPDMGPTFTGLLLSRPDNFR
jgi:hypothetical protein